MLSETQNYPDGAHACYSNLTAAVAAGNKTFVLSPEDLPLSPIYQTDIKQVHAKKSFTQLQCPAPSVCS